MKIKQSNLKLNEIKPEIKNVLSVENKDNYSNINANQQQEPISTEIIQKILYLYTSSKNSGEEIENNTKNH